MTPLQALERLYGFYDLPNRNEIAYMLEQENLGEYKEIIEKSLKALEIFKSKMTAIYNIRSSPTTLHFDMDLTKEEFHLLEEILK